MRLLSLKLENFRQHRNTDIQFFEGITGILGRNGCGKTTLLEGIAWALYGQRAIQRMERGKVETIRSRGARTNEVPQAELVFALAGQEYKVVRRTNDAALFMSDTKTHTGTEDVTKAISSLLRMDAQAFFTSFFTGQKDLAFLRDVSGRARQEYIGRLLGYERLTKARDLANAEKLALKRDIDVLSQGVGDIEDIRRRKSEAASAVESARAQLAKALIEKQAAENALAEVEPCKIESEARDVRFNSVTNDIALLETQRNYLQDQLNRSIREMAEIEVAEEEFLQLHPLVSEYDELKKRHEVVIDLRTGDVERRGLQSQISTDEVELVRLNEKTRALSQASLRLDKILAEVVGLEQKLRDARASAETAERVWVIERSELEAQSRSLAGRISEIAEHLGQIEKAGPDGICPTCERPLGDEYGKVTGEMSEQIADYRATIQANEVELKLLTKLPIEVNAAKSAIAQLDGSLNDARKREFAARSAGNELAEEQKQVAEVETRAAANRMRMEKIASGFDPAELDRLVRRGQELKPKRDRARELAVKADRREVVSKDVVEQQKSYDKIVAGLAGKTKERDDLGFEPDQHKAVLQQWTVAGQRVQASREQALTAEADVKIAEGSLQERVQEETAHRERAKSLETKRESMRYTEYLTTTFDRFRESLNGEINPRLSESASDLISDITDGRYTEVDLDEEYTPRLFDDGEWKPVISGGEEDVLHLTMRLAISQMIADRAGMDLGLLVLDEVFGSLDESRRENVINLLQNLKGRFQQILLITHIESIHDMVDRAIWVDYDTASGSSRIREVREPFEAAGSEAMESELHPSLSPN